MYMLLPLFLELERWVGRENAKARSAGMPTYPRCTIRVIGQTALLEAALPLRLAATRDVDVYADYPWAVEQKFAELLRAAGQELDPLGREAWMPKETAYTTLHDGTWVLGRIAEPDFVLIAKALKAPEKNRPLLLQYLAEGPSDRFLRLAAKYKVDLEQFL